ncbi:Rieske 2Fe-2S domain-containing protein [Arthrobacter sp. NPDC058192]|uniref:Rieske 2Fe-2S domain-containing protein n=1 Tax=Arthrobacter sp. NPDC058192 TaxID=3346372 RepID=UPI0036EA1B80
MKLDSVVKAVEQFDLLDGAASSLAKAVGKAVSPRPVRNLLSGTYIGHPLHPALTDLPIGAWSMAALLDLAGGRASEPAADALVVVGIATAIPTAAAGLNDWSDTTGKTRRTGVVHALANSAALCLYVSSAIARRSGRRGLGKTLGLAGFGLMSAGGFLGGHLTYADAVNVNKTAERTGPSKWTAVLDADGMSDGDRRTVEVGGVSLLLHRSEGAIHALDAVCSHMGGPLEKGKIENGCVICPWHGSTFRLADGTIVRGPATRPQPAYETRINDGRIEVRRAG